jgi:hypothetical protein
MSYFKTVEKEGRDMIFVDAWECPRPVSLQLLKATI